MSKYPREIVNTQWYWETSHTTESIRTAALLDIARTLNQINSKLDNLGHDGIHSLIRESLKDLRRKVRTQKKRKT